ncbi:MAG: glycosyltransferase family 4 protein [Patescibacteria group bacterium]
MKVLMLGWELPPFNSGGLGVVCYEMSHALANSGAAIDFVVPYEADHKIDFMNVHAAHKLDPLEFRKGAGVYASEQSLRLATDVTELHGMVNQTKEYARGVGSLIQSLEFDVIHAHDWLTMRAGILAKQLSGRPLFVHVHATQFDQAGGKRGSEIIHEIEYMGLAMADRVIAISQRIKDLIIREYGVDPDKIEIVHNKIAAEKFTKVDNHNPYPVLEQLKEAGYQVVVCLGRITVQKGLSTLLHTFKKVVDENPKALLLLAGTGDQLRELQLLAADLGITTNVLFTNSFVSGAAQRWAYRIADLFVMPSISEPFGITAMEAPMQHTPVLVSKQSGVAEVLQNCLKVDHWDVDGMANQIVSALNSPGLLKTLTEASREEIFGMVWSDAAKLLRGHYSQAVAA